MATETNAIPKFDTVNSVIKNPAINKSVRGPSDCISHPVRMHPPLTSQMIASGIAISQNVRQRATSPANNFARNFIQSHWRLRSAIEFDSLAQAIAAHDSPDYKAALAVLGNAAERDFRIVEGVHG
jgi:uncharacterized protein DUF1330